MINRRRYILRHRKKNRILNPLINELLHNESNVYLLPSQKRMLALGLSFIPTGLTKKENLNNELERFRRAFNLKLFWNFRDKNLYKKRSPLISLFKSAWDPTELLSKNSNIWINFISSMEEQVCGSIQSPNCSKNDLIEWKELIQNPNFYVTKAEKGGKIVIWPINEYKNEALRQLTDSNTYQSLTLNHAEAWIRKTNT